MNSKEIPLKTKENCMKVKVAQLCWTLCNHGLYSPWNSPDQNTAVGSHSLLQGIFAPQGSNWSLQHCRQILYQLSHQGSPWILEWAAVPFSKGSSWPRNWTEVSSFAGSFFTRWAIRGAQRELPYDPAISLSYIWKRWKLQFEKIHGLQCSQWYYSQ